MQTFKELSLPKPIEKALAEMNFQTPTPIQAQSIPVTLTGKDLIGIAQTGTGKTAAFGIPMITTLLQNKNQNALILVPTRELANQVTDVLRALTKYTIELRVVNIIGGMSMQPQIRALSKGFRIMVATPGRLVDHLQRKPDLMSKVSFLVLDEADRMLDMGFAPQLKQIFPRLAKERQTLLFSATLAPEINQLAEKLLRNPARVQVGEVSRAAPKIDQQIRHVKQDEKNETLLDEINAREGTILVFSRTQRRTDRTLRYLESYGLSVTSIHGGKSQGQRNRAIQGFRDGTFRVMVATDIAARGIDIDHVAHVINMDLPEVPEDYVHRIGRTARAGRSGEAISFISPDERENWRAIEKLLGKKFQEGQSAPKANLQKAPPKPKTAFQKPVQAQQPVSVKVSPRPEKKKHHRGQQPKAQPQSTGKAFSPFVAARESNVPKNIRFKKHF